MTLPSLGYARERYHRCFVRERLTWQFETARRITDLFAKETAFCQLGASFASSGLMRA